MPLPWLQMLDALIGVTDLARSRRIRSMASERDALHAEAGGRAAGGPDTRLAGAIVAALKEAFERDTRRLELERDRLEAERQRAERALRLERLGQAGDREIGRLRLLAGVAVAGWLGALLLAARLAGGGGAGARVALGVGWLLLVAAIGASFSAQSAVARAVERQDDPLPAGLAGAIAPWLVVASLALIGLAGLL